MYSCHRRLINGIFKTGKFKSSQEACFFFYELCKLFLISENKNARVPDTCYMNNNYANVMKFEDCIQYHTEQVENTKRAERKKLVSPENR